MKTTTSVLAFFALLATLLFSSCGKAHRDPTDEEKAAIEKLIKAHQAALNFGQAPKLRKMCLGPEQSWLNKSTPYQGLTTNHKVTVKDIEYTEFDGEVGVLKVTLNIFNQQSKSSSTRFAHHLKLKML